MLEGLEKIKASSTLTIVLTASVIIIPGFVYHYVFHRELFMILDAYKLTIASLNLGVPVLSCNYFLVIWHGALIKRNPNDGLESGVLTFSVIAALLTVPVIYLPMAMGYFFSMTSTTVLRIIFAFEVIMIGLLLLQGYANNRSNSQTSK